MIPPQNKKMKKILIVDDEPDILELLSYNLQKEGFETSGLASGEEVLRTVNEEEYNLIILDLMLPGIQGLELCRLIKSSTKTSGIPIIMLTAKSDELDKVLGLELGADDYITKPFSPRELLARVKAVLRRSERQVIEASVITIGSIKINVASYQVFKHGKLIELSATEFKLLLYMAQSSGKVFSRDMLLDAVWEGASYVEPRTVDVHIRRLRTQIEDDPSNPGYIKTRRGVGYYVACEQ